jgi:putative ABC transport system substrate-binding protein
MNPLRRRIAGALLAAAFGARAQTPAGGAVRTVGFLLEGDGYPRNTLKRLAELGLVEGRNLRVIVRRVPPLADAAQLEKAANELARSGAEVLVGGRALNVVALHKATQKIPIVTLGVSNPVRLGLAKSLREPQTNVTGLSFGLDENAMLQVAALRSLRPRLKRMILLVSPNDRFGGPEHEIAGAALGVKVEEVPVERLSDVERVLAAVRDPAAEAAWVAPLAPALTSRPIAQIAMRHKIVTHGMGDQDVRDGLLISYWLIHADATRQVASIVDKVLRGPNPATIPFELPQTTNLVLNRATAKALGIPIPEEIMLRATEVVG